MVRIGQIGDAGSERAGGGEGRERVEGRKRIRDRDRCQAGVQRDVWADENTRTGKGAA